MSASEQTRMKRKHVFAVNDSVEFLEVLRELLQEEQYNVTTTNIVPDTFEQIEALQPDLLMIDLAVGFRAGWELLERVASASATKDIPVIVFSTSPNLLEEAKSQPERFGGQRFLNKPVDLDEVTQAIDALIGKA